MGWNLSRVWSKQKDKQGCYLQSQKEEQQLQWIAGVAPLCVAWQHDTSECETLQAQAKKLKGDNGDFDKNGKKHNMSWQNDVKEETEDSKKLLDTLLKKATQLIKTHDLNPIELMKEVESVKKHIEGQMT